MEIQRYLAILNRNRSFILVFTLAAVLAALSLTYVLSEKYVAGTAIFYRPTEMSILRQKETEAFGAPVPMAPFKVIGQTLRDAVESEAILRQVVEELELHKTPEPTYSGQFEYYYRTTKDAVKQRLLDAWAFMKFGRVIEDDPLSSAIARLRANIDIEATKDSYIYLLTVRDKSPVRAARIVDVAGRTLVDWLHTEHQDPAMKRLAELERQLLEKEQQTVDLHEEKRRILADNDLISVEEEQSKGLKNLYDLELEDVRISSLIERKRREIDEYEEQIDKRFDTFVQSGDLERLRSELLFGQAELEGLIAERGRVRGSIEDIKQRLQKLPTLKKKLDTIDMRITTTTREFLHLKDFYTEVFSQLSTERSEARVMHPAVIPSRPIQPIKIYHVILAALLGLTLSSGLVYILDYLNITAYSSERRSGSLVTSAEAPGLRPAALPKVAISWLILEELARNMSARGGSLFLRDKGRLVQIHSIDPGHAPQAISLPLNENSVFHQAMATGKPVLIGNIEEDEAVNSSGWVGYSDRSLLVLPIPDEKGDCIGVISLHNKEAPPFDDQDMELGMALLTYHMSRSQATLPASMREPVSERIGPQSGSRWKRILAIARPILIILCGLALGVIASYLLRKIGY